MNANEIQAICVMMGIYAEQEDLYEEDTYLEEIYLQEQREEDNRRMWNEYFEEEHRAGRM